MNTFRQNNYTIEANSPSCAVRKEMADAYSAKWFEQAEPALNDRRPIRDCSDSGGSLSGSLLRNLPSPHISILFLQRYFFTSMATVPARRLPFTSYEH
jgi:hypothetical protein